MRCSRVCTDWRRAAQSPVPYPSAGMRPAADTAQLERAIESRIPMQRARHTARRSPRNMRHPVPACDRASFPVRTALVLVIVPPLNVTSPSLIETTPPPSPCAQPSRTRRRLRPTPPPPPPTRIGPGTHRCPPARTRASAPDIATPSNSAAPLSMVITPPPLPYCARVQRAARSGEAPARRPHRA
jgi:hypothetical protein